MDTIHVGIVTGLGEVASHHFASSFRDNSQKFRRTVLIVEHHVGAERVIPVLSHAQKIWKILQDALISRQQVSYELILIPCNSVHIATTYLKRVFGDSFVPIDEATISQIEYDGRQGRFLILGTNTTVGSDMYQGGLRRLGFESVVLPPSAQASFDDFIFKELVSGEMTSSHLHALRALELQYMELLGADHVILACTELCYLVQVFSCPLACEVDSLQALHNAGIERLQFLLRDDSNYAN